MGLEEVLEAAKAAKAAGSNRFCMGAAWREPKDRDIEKVTAMIKGVKALGEENGFKVVCYGHAGDGNLHIRINHPTIKKSFESDEMKNILTSLFELVKKLGGTISGEHGIGLIQKSYMPVMFDKVTLELMSGIKKTFDPNNILNPGKIFNLTN
jgi:glycolate oxidase